MRCNALLWQRGTMWAAECRRQNACFAARCPSVCRKFYTTYQDCTAGARTESTEQEAGSSVQMSYVMQLPRTNVDRGLSADDLGRERRELAGV